MVSYIRGRGLRKLSDAEIVSRYLAGDSSTDIGLDANCLPDTVLCLVRRSGGTVRRPGQRRPRKALPLDDEQICKLYREGLSAPTIADRCGVTAAPIYAVLRAHGVERRKAGDVSRAIYAAMKSARRGMPP